MQTKSNRASELLSVRSGPPRHRILIVDDHPIFREGLAQSIGRQADLAVIGEAENVPQALKSVEDLHPDLVIVDITLPGKSGLELVKDFRALHPELKVLAVSMHEESLYASRILRAGARGYVMKQESPEKLIRAIYHMLNGGIYVSERMSAQILESFSGHPDKVGSSPIQQLSDREFEVFHLVGQGCKNQEIAEQLHLSLKTVSVHLSSIRRKLGLRTSSDLVRFAARWESTPARLD